MVRIRSTRLVSFVQRAVAAIHYEVEAVDRQVRIVVQSTLVANEPVPEQTDDPRAAAALRAPLVGEFHVGSAMFFDLGVFCEVLGSALLIITSLAHQSVRAHRIKGGE